MFYEFQIGDRIILNHQYLAERMNWIGHGNKGTIIGITGHTYFPIIVKWDNNKNIIEYAKMELTYYIDAIDKLKDVL